MKLLMTVQPKNGEKPSDPMLIDTNESDLCCLSDAFLRTGDKVLIFQPVAEYKAAPRVGCDPVIESKAAPCVGCDPVIESKAAPCVESFKKE